MPFYEALKFLLTMHCGAKVTRKSWNDRMKYLCKSFNDGEYQLNLVQNVNNYLVETIHNTTQEELMANDWIILEN